MTVGDVRLQKPAVITLTGKGNKSRHVPPGANTAAPLGNYLTEFRLDMLGRDGYPVFFNQQHTKLSRGGIAWLIDKYRARMDVPSLARVKISPHVLRHSKAMHLYEAGTPLPYIRGILGHIDLSTTEIYVRVSTEAKRKALEVAYVDVISSDMPEWNQDAGLLVWLTSL
ncbi:TPA: tyrosine-type recombinase/integrase [Salmonella enterica subsp. enterica serovar Reading]